MSHLIMFAVHSSVTHECLDHISIKYHIVDEDGVILPGPTMLIDHLPASKVDFYLYYFEVGYNARVARYEIEPVFI